MKKQQIFVSYAKPHIINNLSSIIVSLFIPLVIQNRLLMKYLVKAITVISVSARNSVCSFYKGERERGKEEKKNLKRKRKILTPCPVGR